MARLALAVLAASAMALRPATRVARTPTRQHLFGGAPPEEDTPASPPPGQGGGQTMSVPGLGDDLCGNQSSGAPPSQLLDGVRSLELRQAELAEERRRRHLTVAELKRRNALTRIDANMQQVEALAEHDAGRFPRRRHHRGGDEARDGIPPEDGAEDAGDPRRRLGLGWSSVEVTDAALGEGADKVAQGVVDAAKQAQGEALVKMKAIMQDMQKDIAKTLQADMK